MAYVHDKGRGVKWLDGRESRAESDLLLTKVLLMPDPFDAASAIGMDVPASARDAAKPASRHISKFQKIPALLAVKGENACLMKLYWWIGHYGRGSDMGCWASVNTLAERCGRDKRRVQEDLARLRELGLIKQIGEGPRGTKCWALVSEDQLPVPTLDDLKGGSRVSPRSKRKRQAAEVAPEGKAAVPPRDTQWWQESTPTGVEGAPPTGVESAPKQEPFTTRTLSNNPQSNRGTTANAVLPSNGYEDGKPVEAVLGPIKPEAMSASNALLDLAVVTHAVCLDSPTDLAHWHKPSGGLKRVMQTSADRGELEGAIEAVVRGLVWSRMMGSPARNQILLVDWIGRGSSGVDAQWAGMTAGPTGVPMGHVSKNDVDELLDGLELIRWSAEGGYGIDHASVEWLQDELDDKGFSCWNADPADASSDHCVMDTGEYLLDPEEDIDVA